MSFFYRKYIDSKWILILFFLSCSVPKKDTYNMGFEVRNNNQLPESWILYWNEQNEGYDLHLDSTIIKTGNYSLNISKARLGGEFGVCQYKISDRFSGNKITLRGYIKTEKVTDGYAGLWMRVDSDSIPIQFDNMQDQGLSGDNDWTLCEITLPYDSTKATCISIGGLLTGNGKMWLDDLNLFVDGADIQHGKEQHVIVGINKNKTISGYSDISFKDLDSTQIQTLTDLGILWGFLKYHHSAIADGKIDWDNELLKILTIITDASQRNNSNQIFENWIARLDKTVLLSKYTAQHQLANEAYLDKLFGQTHLSKRLKLKLKEYYLLEPRRTKHYYYTYAPNVGNVIFKNETYYNQKSVADVKIRLLALYRYWNEIQYFNPNQYKLNRDWVATLKQNIPAFINCKNYTEYILHFKKLICSINDSHADVMQNSILDSLMGNKILPYQVKFIENKLVVMGQYLLNNSNVLQRGDIILKINNNPIETLVDKYLPYTSGSNLDTKLRNLCSSNGFLTRTNDKQMSVEIMHNNKIMAVTLNTIDLNESFFDLDINGTSISKAYSLLDNGAIGYIFPHKLKVNDVVVLRELFKNTKGLIFDLRCYPSAFMPFEYGSWLKSKSSPFARFTFPDFYNPGNFMQGDVVSNGGTNSRNHIYHQGRIAIIVNANTQSQAEYTTMALQSVPKSVVIGSITAGADGNISKIILPGGIETWFSGIGVYYPNGEETQNVGVKIDIYSRPTIDGIKAGKDEVLERAIKYIQNGK